VRRRSRRRGAIESRARYALLRGAGLCTACKAPSPHASRCAECRTPGNTAAAAPRYTPKDIARWIDLRRSGLPVSVIAARVGASRRAIYKRTANCGLRAPGRPSRFAPDALTRWADLYRGGLSVRAVAAREEVSVGAVVHGLQKQGVAMRRPGRPVSNASTPKELSR